MKQTFSQSSLDTIEIDVLPFDCETGTGNESPNLASQDVGPEPDSELHIDLKSHLY